MNPAEQMAVVMESVTPLIELAAGYKARCEAAGFSPSVAEQMGLTLHNLMLTQCVLNGASG